MLPAISFRQSIASFACGDRSVCHQDFLSPGFSGTRIRIKGTDGNTPEANARIVRLSYDYRKKIGDRREWHFGDRRNRP
jgi:hypothetical protein